MISLLTAFLLVHGDASWYWWVFWVVLAFMNFMSFVQKEA